LPLRNDAGHHKVRFYTLQRAGQYLRNYAKIVNILKNPNKLLQQLRLTPTKSTHRVKKKEGSHKMPPSYIEI
jgi:hypothetical protein